MQRIAGEETIIALISAVGHVVGVFICFGEHLVSRFASVASNNVRTVVYAQHGRELMGFKSPTGGQCMKL